MNIDQFIGKKFKKEIVAIKAGEFLFKQKDALKVVDACKKLDAVILGLDFWKLCDDGAYMETNSTAWDDFNQGNAASKKTVKEAQNLIKQGLPDDSDYVSFILADQDVML